MTKALPHGPAQHLRQHLEWSDGPWLGFVFADDLAAVRQLQTDVRSAVGSMRVIQPETPQDLRTVLTRLVDEPGADLVWVVAIHPEEDSTVPGAWTEAWDWVLMRSNERRQLLLQHSRGVLFVAPIRAKSRVREAAPDLWSVRALALELPPHPNVPRSPLAKVPTQLQDVQAFVVELDRSAGLAAADDLRRTAEALYAQGWAEETAAMAEEWVAQTRALPTAAERDEHLASALELRARTLRQLGDAQGACMDVVEALGLRGALANGEETTPARRAALARCHSLHGQLLLEAGLLPDAQVALREALELRLGLAAWSDDAETLADLAMSWSLLGDLALERGGTALEEAEQAYREAMRLRRRLAEETSAPRHRRMLSIAWGRLGRALMRQGQHRAAQKPLQLSVALATALASEDQGNVARRMEASVAQTQLAAAYQALGELERAEAALGEAVALRRRLVAEAPAHERWSTNLAVALGRRAEVALLRGDHHLAQRAASEALELSRAHVTPKGHRGLAIAWLRCGDVAWAQRRDEEARRAWAKSTEAIASFSEALPAAAASLRSALAEREARQR